MVLPVPLLPPLLLPLQTAIQTQASKVERAIAEAISGSSDPCSRCKAACVFSSACRPSSSCAASARSVGEVCSCRGGTRLPLAARHDDRFQFLANEAAACRAASSMIALAVMALRNTSFNCICTCKASIWSQKTRRAWRKPGLVV